MDVVGLGPGSSELLNIGLKDNIQKADLICVRTVRHPSAERFLSWCHEYDKEVIVLDDVYERSESFADVYDEMVACMTKAAKSGRVVLYAVPGSPSVGERTVTKLKDQKDFQVTVHPALSFLDLAWNVLDIDPIEGVTITDCYQLLTEASRYSGSVLVMQCYSMNLVEDLMVLAEENASRVIVLYHLGLPDEEVQVAKDYSWPLQKEPDHLSSIFIEDLKSPLSKLVLLWDTIRTLRVRCPWDAEQTHQSLSRHVLEESYEVVEAIDEVAIATDDDLGYAMEHLKEELGDLLIQVLFHANLAREEGWFSIDDVAVSTENKLRYRHPHVFGDVQVDSSAQVVSNWEQLKRLEKSRSSILDGVSKGLPTTIKLEKLYRKFKSIGGDMSHVKKQAADATLGLNNDSPVAEKLYLLSLEALEAKIDLDTLLRRLSQIITKEVSLMENEPKV